MSHLSTAHPYTRELLLVSTFASCIMTSYLISQAFKGCSAGAHAILAIRHILMTSMQHHQPSPAQPSSSQWLQHVHNQWAINAGVLHYAVMTTEGMLAQRVQLKPVLRAACTSGTVMAVADVVCQRIQSKGTEPVDWRRTARFSLVGFTLHGPYFLLGFQTIDRVFGPATNLGMAFKKTAAGQVTLFPCYLVAFFMYMGLLEGKGVDGAVSKLQSNFGPTFASGSVFWPIANMINFSVVPSTSRVLYVNACGLLWNTFLSWVNSNKDKSS